MYEPENTNTTESETTVPNTDNGHVENNAEVVPPLLDFEANMPAQSNGTHNDAHLIIGDDSDDPFGVKAQREALEASIERKDTSTDLLVEYEGMLSQQPSTGDNSSTSVMTDDLLTTRDRQDTSSSSGSGSVAQAEAKKTSAVTGFFNSFSSALRKTPSDSKTKPETPSTPPKLTNDATKATSGAAALANMVTRVSTGIVQASTAVKNSDTVAKAGFLFQNSSQVLSAATSEALKNSTQALNAATASTSKFVKRTVHGPKKTQYPGLVYKDFLDKIIDDPNISVDTAVFIQKNLITLIPEHAVLLDVRTTIAEQKARAQKQIDKETKAKLALETKPKTKKAKEKAKANAEEILTETTPQTSEGTSSHSDKKTKQKTKKVAKVVEISAAPPQRKVTYQIIGNQFIPISTPEDRLLSATVEKQPLPEVDVDVDQILAKLNTSSSQIPEAVRSQSPTNSETSTRSASAGNSDSSRESGTLSTTPSEIESLSEIVREQFEKRLVIEVDKLLASFEHVLEDKNLDNSTTFISSCEIEYPKSSTANSSNEPVKSFELLQDFAAVLRTLLSKIRLCLSTNEAKVTPEELIVLIDHVQAAIQSRKRVPAAEYVELKKSTSKAETAKQTPVASTELKQSTPESVAKIEGSSYVEEVITLRFEIDDEVVTALSSMKKCIASQEQFQKDYLAHRQKIIERVGGLLVEQVADIQSAATKNIENLQLILQNAESNFAAFGLQVKEAHAVCTKNLASRLIEAAPEDPMLARKVAIEKEAEEVEKQFKQLIKDIKDGIDQEEKKKSDPKEYASKLLGEDHNQTQLDASLWKLSGDKTGEVSDEQLLEMIQDHKWLERYQAEMIASEVNTLSTTLQQLKNNNEGSPSKATLAQDLQRKAHLENISTREGRVEVYPKVAQRRPETVIAGEPPRPTTIQEINTRVQKQQYSSLKAPLLVQRFINNVKGSVQESRKQKALREEKLRLQKIADEAEALKRQEEANAQALVDKENRFRNEIALCKSLVTNSLANYKGYFPIPENPRLNFTLFHKRHGATGVTRAQEFLDKMVAIVPASDEILGLTQCRKECRGALQEYIRNADGGYANNSFKTYLIREIINSPELRTMLCSNEDKKSIEDFIRSGAEKNDLYVLDKNRQINIIHTKDRIEFLTQVAVTLSSASGSGVVVQTDLGNGENSNGVTRSRGSSVGSSN